MIWTVFVQVFFVRVGRTDMITEEMLQNYRLTGSQVRVGRDADPANDVLGIVVAWDEETVLLRKANRKLVKLSREYRFEAVPAKGE